MRLWDGIWSGDPGTRGIYCRCAVEMGCVAFMIYLMGWGPTLAIGFVFGAAENIGSSASRATLPAIADRILSHLHAPVMALGTTGGDAPGADAAIVQAVITMGHALGLRITAEGVERVSQADRLRALGCDSAAGFHFSHALAPDVIHAVLHRDGTVWHLLGDGSTARTRLG